MLTMPNAETVKTGLTSDNATRRVSGLTGMLTPEGAITRLERRDKGLGMELCHNPRITAHIAWGADYSGKAALALGYARADGRRREVLELVEIGGADSLGELVARANADGAAWDGRIAVDQTQAAIAGDLERELALYAILDQRGRLRHDVRVGAARLIERRRVKGAFGGLQALTRMDGGNDSPAAGIIAMLACMADAGGGYPDMAHVSALVRIDQAPFSDDPAATIIDARESLPQCLCGRLTEGGEIAREYLDEQCTRGAIDTLSGIADNVS